MKSFDLLKKNTNIDNYYYFLKVFTDEEIQKIIDISQKYDSHDGNVSGVIDYSYRKSIIRWLPQNDETMFIYNKIVGLMKTANNTMWNFNITNLVDNIQISEYEEGITAGHYDWHMDFGKNNSTRKISVSVQLTDENTYEGGDLEMMIHRSMLKAPREKGTVIFFPSYITHRVTPVIKGKRLSLVFWFHGPPFI
jgi:PKHD-type hydroxylase